MLPFNKYLKKSYVQYFYARNVSFLFHYSSRIVSSGNSPIGLHREDNGTQILRILFLAGIPLIDSLRNDSFTFSLLSSAWILQKSIARLRLIDQATETLSAVASMGIYHRPVERQVYLIMRAEFLCFYCCFRLPIWMSSGFSIRALEIRRKDMRHKKAICTLRRNAMRWIIIRRSHHNTMLRYIGWISYVEKNIYTRLNNRL